MPFRTEPERDGTSDRSAMKEEEEEAEESQPGLSRSRGTDIRSLV